MIDVEMSRKSIFLHFQSHRTRCSSDAPSFDKLCQICVCGNFLSIYKLGSFSKYTFHGYIHVFTYWWQQVRTGSKYVKIFHKAMLLLQMNLSGNYSKYFNYWVRMDPIWNAVDFVGKFNTGFTYLGINYDFIQTSQL